MRLLDAVADFATKQQSGASKIDIFVIAGAPKVKLASKCIRKVVLHEYCMKCACMPCLCSEALPPHEHAVCMPHHNILPMCSVCSVVGPHGCWSSRQTSSRSCAHCHGPVQHITC